MLDDTAGREPTVGGQGHRRGISIHEMHTAAQLSALLPDVEQFGLDISAFGLAAQLCNFAVRSANDDGSRLAAHSGLEMLAQGQAFGRRRRFRC
jgi:hypothetical protein